MTKTRNLVTTAITPEVITNKIFVVRGKKVMLDRDLAAFYGVETRVLNQAVKRNIKRFPSDFMFRLNASEMKNWISQFVISNSVSRMGLRQLPYAFTDYGVAMLSGILNSDRSIQINIMIMRAFIALKDLPSTQTKIIDKIKLLEQKTKDNENDIEVHESDIQELFLLIDQLQAETEKTKNPGKLI